MHHAEAEESHAVERYLMNEMNDDEREQFEEHYFDCGLCAADVTEGERMMASGRVVASEAQKVVPFAPRRSWSLWISAAAAALLIVLLTVPLMRPRSGPSSEVLDAHLVAAGRSRAGGTEVITLRAKVTNLLVVEVPPDKASPPYELQLRTSAGKVVTTSNATAEQAAQGVNLLLRSLPAGSYVLVIHGTGGDGNRAVIATHEVRVR